MLNLKNTFFAIALIVAGCGAAHSQGIEPAKEEKLLNKEDVIFKEIVSVCSRVQTGVPKILNAFLAEQTTRVPVPAFKDFKMPLFGPFETEVEKKFEEIVDKRVIVFYNAFYENRELIAVTKEDQVQETTNIFRKITEKDCRANLADDLVPGYPGLY